MSQNKTVKQAVFSVLNTEIESGRLTLEQLLKPVRWGQCNDLAMIVQGMTQNSRLTGETVREETVLRYVRQYKALKLSQLAAQNSSTNAQTII
jgi:hypothetical protein